MSQCGVFILQHHITWSMDWFSIIDLSSSTYLNDLLLSLNIIAGLSSGDLCALFLFESESYDNFLVDSSAYWWLWASRGLHPAGGWLRHMHGVLILSYVVQSLANLDRVVFIIHFSSLCAAKQTVIKPLKSFWNRLIQISATYDTWCSTNCKNIVHTTAAWYVRGSCTTLLNPDYD